MILNPAAALQPAASPHASPKLSSVCESETAVASMAPTTAALRSARTSREKTASPALDPAAPPPCSQGQLVLTLDASTHSNYSTHSHAHSNGTAPSTQAGGNMDLQFILAAAIKFCDLGARGPLHEESSFPNSLSAYATYVC